MNLSNEIIGGILLALLFCVILLIRYVIIGRAIILKTQTRLCQVEEEVHRHPLTCPLKQQIEKLLHAAPAEKPFPMPEYLQSRLLTSEEEANFRNVFASVHPDMLPRLRSICSQTTRADELLCMLILLKHSNEEISYLLGISRSSVLKKRYRLRAKLKLPEDADLDTEVRRLLSSETDVELSVSNQNNSLNNQTI